MTTEHRIRHHLLTALGGVLLSAFTVAELQAFLNSKASSLSRSMVAHLRWDLHSLFRLAVAQGYIERSPTASLYTPRSRAVAPKKVLTRKEVEQYLSALEQRERIVAQLAIFVGMRPGEILGLQRRHVSADARRIIVDQRLYRGEIDTPKTDSSVRTVAVPSDTARRLAEWMTLVGEEPEAFVFVSENRDKPIWRDNLWHRSMKPLVDEHGLGWANFQVLRRTHASLGHEAGVDPKVAADQRGHGIGVALDVYTQAALPKRQKAAEKLEKSVRAAYWSESGVKAVSGRS